MSHARSSRSVRRTPALLIGAALLSVVLLVASVSLAGAHDLFLKPATFFVPENGETLVRVLNGTFSVSENAIARPRVADITVVSPTGRQRLDTSAWSAAGDTSTFKVRVGVAGTYVLGASTRPNIIAMSGDTFNLYLREDGIPDVLEARRRDGELARRVKERYHKHVKALLGGGTRTDSYATELGYPAELVPLSNPYSARVGEVMQLRTLVDGRPAPNQYVLYGGRTPSGGRIEQRGRRSDSAGVVSVPQRTLGIWYVKFIHMARLSGDTAADYESKWATITFELR